VEVTAAAAASATMRACFALALCVFKSPGVPPLKLQGLQKNLFAAMFAARHATWEEVLS